jgi:hypothetical protein
VRRGNLLDTFGAENAPQSTRAFSFQAQLDLALECYTLDAGSFDTIAHERPSLMITLLR